jgi:hypothetical protein
VRVRGRHHERQRERCRGRQRASTGGRVGGVDSARGRG